MRVVKCVVLGSKPTKRNRYQVRRPSVKFNHTKKNENSLN